MAQRIAEWIFGIPWVFQNLRQWVLGSVDFKEAYARLEVVADDIVLDIGCGMGAALDFLDRFGAYHGFDTDARAIAEFRRKSPRGRVWLYERACLTDDVRGIKPTKVLMIGLLHHIGDDEAHEIFSALAAEPAVQAIATVDTVYIPGRKWNNLLARFDRGRYVRTVEEYRGLVGQSGLERLHEFWIDSGNGAASYYCMILGVQSRVPNLY